MLFVIGAVPMNGSEKVLYALDAIVLRVEDEVHEVEIRDADQLEQSTWYELSRPDRRKLLEEIAEASLYRSPRTQGPHLRRFEVVDAASAALARASAYAPLLVLLENDGSDGELIEAALRTFAHSTTIELCFGPPSRLEPPSFRMESRGGHGELRKLVATCLREASDRGRPPRIVVVTDSDGEWPGDVKKHASDIREDCERVGVPCPPLDKRTAENYIPDAVWRAWVAVRERVAVRPAIEALLRLSPEQRDHIDMKKQGSDPWNQEEPKVAALFAGVSEGDRALLKAVDLKGKRKTMVIKALKNHREALTQDEFMARDGNGNLVEIVRQIQDEL